MGALLRNLDHTTRSVGAYLADLLGRAARRPGRAGPTNLVATGTSYHLAALSDYSDCTASTKSVRLASSVEPLANCTPPPWPMPCGLDRIRLAPLGTFLMKSTISL